MTLSLIRHTLRSRRLAVFWFSVGMLLYALMVMGLWPSSSQIDFTAYLKDFPDALKAAFLGAGYDSASVQQSSFYQYLGSQFATWMPVVLGYFGIWVGAGVIARDYGGNTLDLLLAQPLDRVRFVLARFAGVVLAALPVVAVSAAGLIAGVAFWGQGVELSAIDIILVHVHLFLFTLATAAIGLLLATLLLAPGRTYGVGALVLVAMYIVNLVAQFVDPLAWAGYGSLFRYWRPLAQFVSGEFVWGDAIATGSIALGALLAAVLVFRRRDIAT